MRQLVIGGSNAWFDAFKAVLVRFETNKNSLESPESNSFSRYFITSALNNFNIKFLR